MDKNKNADCLLFCAFYITRSKPDDRMIDSKELVCTKAGETKNLSSYIPYCYGQKRSNWNERDSWVYLFLIITFSNLIMKNVESNTGTQELQTMHFPLSYFIFVIAKIINPCLQ